MNKLLCTCPHRADNVHRLDCWTTPGTHDAILREFPTAQFYRASYDIATHSTVYEVFSADTEYLGIIETTTY